MPSYDYTCECGHKVETFEPMSAPTEQPCPVCAESGCESTMKRQIGKIGRAHV